MNIDIISQICVFCDYPIYRQLLTKYRDKFKKIILYPSRHHGVIDMEEFMRKTFPETWVTGHTIDWTTPGIDWRQAETEPCIRESTAEWILFMEQDFFVDDWDKLWKDVEEAMKTSDMIGWWNDTEFSYVHPCFLLIKRELLEKTSKDFRAHPEIPGCDHFAMITHDAEKLGAKITKLQDVEWKNWENAFHMGGLTYPYQDFNGLDTRFGVQNPSAFYAYNYFSRIAPVEQSNEYINLSRKVENVLKTKLTEPEMDVNKWTKFFKI